MFSFRFTFLFLFLVLVVVILPIDVDGASNRPPKDEISMKRVKKVEKKKSEKLSNVDSPKKESSSRSMRSMRSMRSSKSKKPLSKPEKSESSHSKRAEKKKIAPEPTIAVQSHEADSSKNKISNNKPKEVVIPHPKELKKGNEILSNAEILKEDGSSDSSLSSVSSLSNSPISSISRLKVKAKPGKNVNSHSKRDESKIGSEMKSIKMKKSQKKGKEIKTDSSEGESMDSLSKLLEKIVSGIEETNIDSPSPSELRKSKEYLKARENLNLLLKQIDFEFEANREWFKEGDGEEKIPRLGKRRLEMSLEEIKEDVEAHIISLEEAEDDYEQAWAINEIEFFQSDLETWRENLADYKAGNENAAFLSEIDSEDELSLD